MSETPASPDVAVTLSEALWAADDELSNATAMSTKHLAEFALEWFAARLADPAVIEAVAERLSWDGGDFTRWKPDAVDDHNRWSWRGGGHGDVLRAEYRERARVAIAAVAELVAVGEVAR